MRFSWKLKTDRRPRPAKGPPRRSVQRTVRAKEKPRKRRRQIRKRKIHASIAGKTV